jgi:protein-tyrosine phosphatase
LVKVLFVCTGNICRSPTADGLLRAQVAAAGLAQRITVDSAGTHGYHSGDPPDPRSVATARRHGVHLDGLRSRKLVAADFTSFQIIAALDRSHLSHLLTACPPDHRDRIRLLMSFAPGGLADEVPDPYYGGEDGFETVFRMIERGVAGLFDHLVQNRGLWEHG